MLALDFMLHGGGNLGVGLGERQGHAVGCHTEILTHAHGLILGHQFSRNVLILITARDSPTLRRGSCEAILVAREGTPRNSARNELRSMYLFQSPVKERPQEPLLYQFVVFHCFSPREGTPCNSYSVMPSCVFCVSVPREGTPCNSPDFAVSVRGFVSVPREGTPCNS